MADQGRRGRRGKLIAYLNWTNRPTTKSKEWLKQIQAEENAKAERKARRRKRKGKGAEEAPDLEPALKIKTLEDEPKLSPHLFWVWQAFTDLNYRRPTGYGGPQPIPYVEMEAYCRLKGIYSPGEREKLLRNIDKLDRLWMQQAHEDIEKKNSPTPPPPSQSPPRGGGTKSPPRTEVT